MPNPTIVRAAKSEVSDQAIDWQQIPSATRRRVIKWICISGGAVCIFLITLFFVSDWLRSTRPKRADRATRKYLQETLPAIIGSWNFDELESRMGSVLKVRAEREGLASIFTNAADRLGPLQNLGEPHGSVLFSKAILGRRNRVPGTSIRYPGLIWGDYAIRCEFEKSQAQIRVGLSAEGGKWLIDRFEIESDALLGRMNVAK